MDAGLTIRPTASAARTGYRRRDANRSKVANELASSPGGTAPAGIAAIGSDADARLPGARGYNIDPQSREVIYRAIDDLQSRRIVRQTPQEAALKLKAYVWARARGEAPNEAEAHADLQA
jgi:hypothetical protein